MIKKKWEFLGTKDGAETVINVNITVSEVRTGVVAGYLRTVVAVLL